jgi:hypothetical protein
MSPEQKMDQRLWEYIDGLGDEEERSAIRQLIDAVPAWKSKYAEWSAIHAMISNQELEAPSLRFTRNVMEEIARHQVAPAAVDYINKNIVRGIGGFFGVLILGLVAYLLRQTHWTGEATGSFIPSYDIGKLNLGKILNNGFVDVFVLVNAVLALVLLDKYLRRKRRETAGAKPVS